MNRWGADQGAAIQAFEAVLAAIIILTALVFFALVQRPAPPEQTTGLDLQQVAADALAALAQGSPDRLQVDVLAALGGASDAFQADLPGLLPPGTRWAVSLDNGFGSLLLDTSESAAFSEPRGASGASAYVVLGPAQWSGTGTDPDDRQPGGALPAGSVTAGCAVDSPRTTATGEVNGPTGTWAQLWANTGAGSVVPAFLPFGTWTISNCGDADGAFDVIFGTTTASNPLYSVNLVVWTLA